MPFNLQLMKTKWRPPLQCSLLVTWSYADCIYTENAIDFFFKPTERAEHDCFVNAVDHGTIVVQSQQVQCNPV